MNLKKIKIFKNAINKIKSFPDTEIISVSDPMPVKKEKCITKVLYNDCGYLSEFKFTAMQYIDVTATKISQCQLIKFRIYAGTDGIKYKYKTSGFENISLDYLGGSYNKALIYNTFLGEVFSIEEIPVKEYEELGYKLSHYDSLEYDEKLNIVDNLSCPYKEKCIHEDPATHIACTTCKMIWLESQYKHGGITND